MVQTWTQSCFLRQSTFLSHQPLQMVKMFRLYLTIENIKLNGKRRNKCTPVLEVIACPGDILKCRPTFYLRLQSVAVIGFYILFSNTKMKVWHGVCWSVIWHESKLLYSPQSRESSSLLSPQLSVPSHCNVLRMHRPFLQRNSLWGRRQAGRTIRSQ